MSRFPFTHPIFRFGNVVALVLLAATTLVISWQINPHSAAWLLGLYTTVFLLIFAFRQPELTALQRSYMFYLAVLSVYLTVIWFLHVTIPGSDPEGAKRSVLFWTRILGTGGILLPVTHFHFARRFADARWFPLRVLEGLGWALTLVLLSLNVLGEFTKDYHWSGVTWVPEIQGAYKVFFYSTTFYLGAGLLIPCIKVFTIRNPQRRLQLLYYLIGDVPLWLSCWGHFLISLGINIYPAGGIIFLWHILVLGYAVLHQRLFDITFVIRRGLAYALVSLFLGVLYGLIIWGITEHWGGGQVASGVLSAILFVSLVGLLYAPLQGEMQRLIDRLFFRTSANRQALLSLFAQRMASTLDLKEVVRCLCELSRTGLGCRVVELYLLNEEGAPFLHATYDQNLKLQLVEREGTLPAFLEERWKTCDVPCRVTVHAAPGAGERIALDEGHEHLLVPILHGGTRLGVSILSPKRSDEPYEEDDLQFARTVAAHSALALLNARTHASLERLQELTRRTIEGLTAGVLLAHEDGRINLCNASMGSILGLPGAAPRYESLSQVFLSHANLADKLRHPIAEKRPVEDVEVQLDDGRRHCLVSLKVLKSEPALEESTFLLLLIHDITNYKNMEALARRREDLARVGEVIASINHELGNILEPMRHHIRELKTMEIADVRFSRALHVIPDRVAALDRLLSSLRDLSRPIALRMRTLDLEDLCQSVLIDVKALQPATEPQWHLEIAPHASTCCADGHWLRLVLFNLVRNATEALNGQADGRISIRTIAEPRGLRIQVSDNGCGIPEEDRQKLFRPFHSTKGEAGTGLGLSVSKKVVELHGGTIEVESQVGHGTTFSVVLPTAPQERTEESARSQEMT